MEQQANSNEDRPKSDGVHRSRWSAIALVIALLALLGLLLIPIAGIVGLIGQACWQCPLLAIPFSLIVIWLIYSIKKIRRTELAEIETFEQRPRNADADLLDELGLAATSEEAQIAIIARRVFAKLGQVSPESVRASNRFYPDLERLPFYDSIDALEIILDLEKELGIEMPSDEEAAILGKICQKESATIGEVILDVVHLAKARKPAPPGKSLTPHEGA